MAGIRIERCVFSRRTSMPSETDLISSRIWTRVRHFSKGICSKTHTHLGEHTHILDILKSLIIHTEYTYKCYTFIQTYSVLHKISESCFFLFFFFPNWQDDYCFQTLTYFSSWISVWLLLQIFFFFLVLMHFTGKNDIDVQFPWRYSLKKTWCKSVQGRLLTWWICFAFYKQRRAKTNLYAKWAYNIHL